MRDQQYDILCRYCDQIFDNDAFEQFSKSTLKVREGLIQEAFDLFRSYHLSYRAEIPNNMVVQNGLYEEAEERYISAMSKIGRAIDEESDRHNTSVESDVSKVIRVETARPPKLISFDGDPSKWPAFHDLFVAEVHNRDLDLVTKLLYLQECCIGKAARTLGAWQPTAENYSAAWDLLKQTYSDNHQIKQSIIDNLFQMKKLKEESYEGLRAILDVMASSLRQLKVLGVPVESWDDIMINIVAQRLPGVTLDSWEQRRISIRNPTLEDLRLLLESKTRGRRALENTVQPREGGNNEQNRRRDNRYRPYPEHRREYGTTRREIDRVARNSDAVVDDRCPIAGCKQNHFVFKCDLFKKLNLKERWQLVKSANLCILCLKPGHRAMDCGFQPCSSCPADKARHNFRLCPGMAYNTTDTRSADAAPRRYDQK